MFICSNVQRYNNRNSIANVRKTVYMQECMNYTIAMLSLGLHNQQVHLHSACTNVC